MISFISSLDTFIFTNFCRVIVVDYKVFEVVQSILQINKKSNISGVFLLSYFIRWIGNYIDC